MIANPSLMEIGKFGSALLGAIKLSKHGALLMESIKDCKKNYADSYLDEANDLIDEWSAQIKKLQKRHPKYMMMRYQ